MIHLLAFLLAAVELQVFSWPYSFSRSLGLMQLFTQAGIIKAAAALGSAAIPRQTNSSYWA